MIDSDIILLFGESWNLNFRRRNKIALTVKWLSLALTIIYVTHLVGLCVIISTLAW